MLAEYAAIVEGLDLAEDLFEFEEREARLRQAQANLEKAKHKGGHSPDVIQQLQAKCEMLQDLLR